MNYYKPDDIRAYNSYPFGSLMPNRHFTPAEGYRYGFNGKENDNEVKGNGNQQDYGERIYDPRLGRFLSIDPLTMVFPWYSPYQFAGNKPIWAIDQDGLEEFFRTDYYNAVGNLYQTEIKMVTNVGAKEGIQTVHHSRVVETIDLAGNSSFNISWSGSRVGTTQGVNAFVSFPINSLLLDNAALSTQIRRRSLNLNAAGTPQRYQLPYPITVTTRDIATGAVTTSVAVNGELVPISDGGPFNIGFYQGLLNANGMIVGVSQRNQNNPRSGVRKFGETEQTFNAANTNTTVPGAFTTNIPNNSPDRQNNVPFFNNGASRTRGSNFGIFGPAKGGFNGRSRTYGAPPRRRRPGVAKF